MRAFACRVLLDAGVPIEMVRREVQQHRDPRLERLDRSRAGSCSPRRRGSCRRCDCVDLRAERAGRCCRRRARGGRRPRASVPVSVVVVDLPFVPVIATIAPAQPARRELELADDGDARAARARRSPAVAAARRDSARRDRRRVNVGRRCPPSSSVDAGAAQLVGLGRAARRTSVSVTRAPRAHEQLARRRCRCAPRRPR